MGSECKIHSTNKPIMLVPLLDLKFLMEFAAGAGANRDRSQSE
jgi:hypothetical protein